MRPTGLTLGLRLKVAEVGKSYLSNTNHSCSLAGLQGGEEEHGMRNTAMGSGSKIPKQRRVNILIGQAVVFQDDLGVCSHSYGRGGTCFA
jgi:hypothetical protein